MSNQDQLQALNDFLEEAAEALQPTLEFMRNQIESTIEAIVPVLHALQSAHDERIRVIMQERKKRALWLARRLRAGRAKRKAAYRMRQDNKIRRGNA